MNFWQNIGAVVRRELRIVRNRPIYLLRLRRDSRVLRHILPYIPETGPAGTTFLSA